MTCRLRSVGRDPGAEVVAGHELVDTVVPELYTSRARWVIALISLTAVAMSLRSWAAS